ncbi:STAS domain-containing protein [Parashewanella curva]|uniref:STAS domain-containing protein n=1 Tax=Parashewanella curva TaxID=2338552 RepID=A0A3L8PY44_9GAMM|nr:STAS domain-containing protein [Parashewanella curva]RLV60261.1 STAS domain-containing protein [Parashewanella curva]
MAKFTVHDNSCSLSGRLSREEVVALWSKRQSLLSSQVSQLDLSELNYIDSSGIAFLFHLVKQQQKNNQTLLLVNPSQQLQSLIALYNLQPMFESKNS